MAFIRFNHRSSMRSGKSPWVARLYKDGFSFRASLAVPLTLGAAGEKASLSFFTEEGKTAATGRLVVCVSDYGTDVHTIKLSKSNLECHMRTDSVAELAGLPLEEVQASKLPLVEYFGKVLTDKEAEALGFSGYRAVLLLSPMGYRE